MIKFLKFILIAVLVVTLIAVAIGFIKKGPYNYITSTEINAPKATVWSLINSFKSQNSWDPWSKLDSNLKSTYSPTDGVVGATYSWDGNAEMGKGKQTISYIAENDTIGVDMQFISPWEGTAKVGYKLSGTDGKVKITQNMMGNSGFIDAIFSTLFGSEKQMITMFDKGLKELKAMAENAKNTGYSVTEVTIPNTILAVTKTANKPFSSITGDFYASQYAKVAAYIQTNKLTSTNAAYSIYKNVNEKMDMGDMYVGMDVNKNSAESNGVSNITINGKAIKVSYFGKYKNTEPAYMALLNYAAKNSLNVDYAIEHFVTDPSTAMGDWTKVQTDIYMVLK